MSYFLQHRPLCLASSSPRRKELSKKFNLEFDCYTPNIDEIPNKNEQAESFVTVSYTHLTLPTIYSV